MARGRSATAEVAPIVDDKVAELERKLAESQAENQALRTLKTVPVSRSGIIDTGEFRVGGANGDVTMDTDSAPVLRKPVAEVDVVDTLPPLEFLEELKFNEELLEVEVHEASDQYPSPTVSVWNGGIHQLFIRGQRQIVKRKFVEVLARTKPITYGNVEYVDAEGNRRVKWPQRTALKYPFQVVRDASPRGREWLRKILAQA